MQTAPKATTINYYMFLIAAHYEELVGCHFGTEIIKQFFTRICPDCRTRAAVATIPANMESPRVMAEGLMLKASETVGFTPTTVVTPLNGVALAFALEHEFNVCAALLLGPCDHAPSAGRDFVNELYRTAEERSKSGFWLRASENEQFLQSFSSACTRLARWASPGEIQLQLIALCSERDVHSIDEAIPVLEEIVVEYEAGHVLKPPSV